MDGFFWPLLLIAVGILMLVLEMFVPSGGLLGVFAALSFVTAIVIGFMHSTYTGASSVLMVSVIIPVFLVLFVRYWPSTPIGRRMLLQRDTQADRADDDDEQEQLRMLIGKRGRTKTKMLPSGAVMIDGRMYDAATEGIALEVGQPVEVLLVSFNRLVVRPIENDAAVNAPPRSSEDPLSRPIEELGISPFEDPLL